MPKTKQPISSEAISNFREVAYRRYQLRWMIDHNWSVQDFAKYLYAAGAVVTDGEPANINADSWDLALEAMKVFEADSGFAGELWACKEEFLNTEYLDSGYMKQIITFPDEKALYSADVLGVK